MTPRGTSLPRLQEFAFLEFALAGVIRGRTYEEIRRDLIAYMQRARDSETLSGNTARHQLGRPSRYAYADNTTEAIREIMRLGLVERAPLPTTTKAVDVYAGTTFVATDAGRELADLARSDRAAAGDKLLALMVDAHSQLAGYMAILQRGPLVVPSANWGELREPRSRPAFVHALAQHGASVLAVEDGGWRADGDEIETFVREYVDRLARQRDARGASDPFRRNEDFVRECEKALVRMAFERAGSPTDYISHEIIRRWLRDRELAAFSYHVPGPRALRLWRVADMSRSDGHASFARRNGEQHLEAVVAGLREGYDTVRGTRHADMPWVAIYQLRAAVCYRLSVSEQVFDAAVNDMLTDKRGANLPFKVNVEVSVLGPTPPTERPLKVHFKRGDRDVHTLALVPRTKETNNE